LIKEQRKKQYGDGNHAVEISKEESLLVEVR